MGTEGGLAKSEKKHEKPAERTGANGSGSGGERDRGQAAEGREDDLKKTDAKRVHSKKPDSKTALPQKQIKVGARDTVYLPLQRGRNGGSVAGSGEGGERGLRGAA